MKVTVNGKLQQVHIGCRSFVRITQLIGLLSLSLSSDLVVRINGKLEERINFGSTQVKCGDKVNIVLREERNNAREKKNI